MDANGWIDEASDDKIHEEDLEEDLEVDSLEVYKHPNGGPLWMNTPRKRLLPIHRLTLSLISTPVQDAPPLWTTQLHS